MYRYLVCSDIHGNIENFNYALEEAYFEGVDGVIIAGDTEIDVDTIRERVSEMDAELYIVRGNCDFGSSSKLSDMMTIELGDGVTCLLTHGHRYHVKSDLYTLEDVANNLNASLAICGHTHVYDDTMMGKVRCINPGALCGSYASRPSYILMTINNGQIDILKRVI